jgi:hypothetical protein
MTSLPQASNCWLRSPSTSDIVLDPARGEAEWLSEWRTDLADFIERQVIEALVVPGRHEIPPLLGGYHVGFVDASGGSGGDSYTAAIAHYDFKSETAILDAIREIRPPFSPEAATADHAKFFKAYSVHRIRGNRYAGRQISSKNMALFTSRVTYRNQKFIARYCRH